MADNDYILRKDALAFQDEIEPAFCFDNKTRNIFSATKDADIVAYLNAIPAADVVEVVRCKDCRYFHNGYDEKCCINHKGVVVTDENGFCHHAERNGEDG